MSTEKSEVSNIDPALLRQYIEMRQRVDVEASTIHSITSLLGHYENLGDDTISIDPVALARVNQILNNSILNILEILDDYIYIVDARLEVERAEED